MKIAVTYFKAVFHRTTSSGIKIGLLAAVVILGINLLKLLGF